VISITATDCWASFAPFLANVRMMFQFDATVVIIIGQSSKYYKRLALNKTHAKHCLSDVEKILESQGPNGISKRSVPFTQRTSQNSLALLWMLMSLSALWTIQDLWLFVERLILSMSVVTKFPKCHTRCC
jgi:hypothetical protein